MYSGTAIALAWPQTCCKQAGAWYDHPMRWLGINTRGYYRAGHAAIVLADGSNGDCLYFDFGRYHAPMGHGRARGSNTDPELRIRAKARFGAGGTLANLGEIVGELADRKACHGDGPLFASTCRIDHAKALAKARWFQAQSPIAYGPFLWGGTNCSRFVCSVLLAGKPPWPARAGLLLPYSISPSPASNVRALGKPVSVPAPRPAWPSAQANTAGVLPAPPLPAGLPAHAQWLAGEGAGSWFVLSRAGGGLLLDRYAPGGEPEETAFFRPVHPLPDSGDLALLQPYRGDKVLVGQGKHAVWALLRTDVLPETPAKAGVDSTATKH